MQTLTGPFVPFAQEAITKDVQTDREERDGEKVQVRVPHRELHRVIRPGNNCGGNELCFVRKFSQPVDSRRESFRGIANRNSPAKTASVVTSVSQPAILIHPTRKLWSGQLLMPLPSLLSL